MQSHDLLHALMLPSASGQQPQYVLNACILATPLGDMLALSNDTGLYALEFVDKKDVKATIKKLLQTLQASIVLKTNPLLELLRQELTAYFKSSLQHFSTPMHFVGTEFQKQVWQEIQKIPYAITITYAQQAVSIKRRKAYRAVANANGANRLAIIVPCHRIIRSDNALGGYAGGVERKQWLLNHEKNSSKL